MSIWEEFEISKKGLNDLAIQLASCLINSEYLDSLDFFTMEERSRWYEDFKDEWQTLTDYQTLTASQENIVVKDLTHQGEPEFFPFDIGWFFIPFSGEDGHFYISGIGCLDRDQNLRVRKIEIGLAQKE